MSIVRAPDPWKACVGLHERGAHTRGRAIPGRQITTPLESERRKAPSRCARLGRFFARGSSPCRASRPSRVGVRRSIYWARPCRRRTLTVAPPTAMQVRCAECGAPQSPLTCRARLELLLAWEVDDDALRGLHFLTVASYNLQHPAPFTDEARTGLEQAFRGYLDGRLTIADIRRQAAGVDGAVRVRRRSDEVRPQWRRWPMTIDAVAVPGQPAHAPARVRAWAEAIRDTLAAT